MGKNTNIEWTDYTFNGWEGCTKISPGCAHCYAETRNHRFGMDNWGKGKPRRRTSAANWKQPLAWNRNYERAINCLRCPKCETQSQWHADLQCPHIGCDGTMVACRRPRVFCASLADWLDDEVPIEWLADLLGLINDTPNLNWLLLTKRPQNWERRIMQAWDTGRSAMDMIARWTRKNNPEPPNNVWIGTSVEDQTRAERVVELCKIPARIRFVSAEPMLSGIDFTNIQFKDEDAEVRFNALTGESWVENSASPSAYDIHHDNKLHWVIFGGESGKGARPCNVNWIRNGVRQCKEVGVAAFVKQLGARPVFEATPEEPTFGQALCALAKVKDKKGGEISQWPQDLRVREFPV